MTEAGRLLQARTDDLKGQPMRISQIRAKEADVRAGAHRQRVINRCELVLGRPCNGGINIFDIESQVGGSRITRANHVNLKIIWLGVLDELDSVSRRLNERRHILDPLDSNDQLHRLRVTGAEVQQTKAEAIAKKTENSVQVSNGETGVIHAFDQTLSLNLSFHEMYEWRRMTIGYRAID